MPGMPGGDARPGGEERARVLVQGLPCGHPEDEGTAGRCAVSAAEGEEEVSHRTSVAFLDHKGLKKFWALCSCGWERWKNEKLAAEKIAKEHRENPDD